MVNFQLKLTLCELFLIFNGIFFDIQLKKDTISRSELLDKVYFFTLFNMYPDMILSLLYRGLDQAIHLVQIAKNTNNNDLL